MAKEPTKTFTVAVQGEPTKHWCRKMRTAFRAWDLGLKGYITEEDLMIRANKTADAYPQLNREDQLESSRQTWIKHINFGLELPKGYRLTEAQYVQNVWLAIHQPSFVEEVREMTISFMEKIDTEKKGHFTHEQYLQLAGKIVGEKEIRAACQAMDTTNCGHITHEDMAKANIFFFTDTVDEHHPFNFVRGPLVD